MNIERFFEAMMFKLSLDQKKLDDELERVVNSDIKLDDKIFQTESVLERLVNLEARIKKFNEVIQIANYNKTDVKNQETSE